MLKSKMKYGWDWVYYCRWVTITRFLRNLLNSHSITGSAGVAVGKKVYTLCFLKNISLCEKRVRLAFIFPRLKQTAASNLRFLSFFPFLPSFNLLLSLLLLMLLALNTQWTFCKSTSSEKRHSNCCHTDMHVHFYLIKIGAAAAATAPDD